MSEEQKQFIEQYVQCKNILSAAEFAGIDVDIARQYYLAYSSQQEIRRINLAMYHRQFAARMVTLDEIGGYLTSLLMDMNVAEADKLKSKEKLEVVKLLMELNKLKSNALDNPAAIMSKDLDSQIKELSIETIKQLLEQSQSENFNEVNKKLELNPNLSIEEKAYLSTLPTNELLDIIEEENKRRKQS